MSVLVPFTDRELSRRPLNEVHGHDRRFPTRSGFWSCNLRTLTPLCIHSAFLKLKPDDPAIIPGSSIRGMVRAVVEILGGACARLYNGSFDSKLEPCTQANTCLACRVFGYTLGDFSWASKLRFADTLRQPAPKASERLFLPQDRGGFAPSPSEPGWILFPHSKTRPVFSSGPTPCVPANQDFKFLIEYTNLDEEEYALIKFALTLTHAGIDLCHKIGYARSAGLGACKISLPNDKSPAIGPAIEPYLASPGYQAFAPLRSYR
jgi:hypothetical protein